MGEVPVIETAYNTLLFTANAIPAAASQVYKEQLFLVHLRRCSGNGIGSEQQCVVGSLNDGDFAHEKVWSE